MKELSKLTWTGNINLLDILHKPLISCLSFEMRKGVQGKMQADFLSLSTVIFNSF